MIEQIKETLNEDFNVKCTENGALGYETTGKILLDLNFSIPKLRKMSERAIYDRFVKAFYEDKEMAIKWLFYSRDIRGGLAERRTFKAIVNNMAKENLLSQDIIEQLIGLIPIYGRWDDMLCLLDTDYRKYVATIIDNQIKQDIANIKNKGQISLLAKWLPSANSSSKESKRLALIICKELNITERMYRKTLAKLRKYLDVVEIKMSAKEWKSIKYANVPSRANLIYNGAFLRNDETRRRKFLESLEKGETKINSSILFPHDIVNKYKNLNKKDIALEEMWKGLPNYVKENSNTLTVVDGSGSMTCGLMNGCNVQAIDISIALGLYFAERCTGEFANKYIEFGSRPQLVDFSKCETLREKIDVARRYSDCENTDLAKVFNLILTTAINHNMKQEEMPSNLLIISDMEFDYGVDYSKRLFTEIEEKYRLHGYKLPKLIFWNVNSRSETIPVKQNENGVVLVSGFSTSIVNMILQDEVDPYKCLIKILDTERYSIIKNIMKGSL